MSNQYYDLYIEDTLKLAETIVIKAEENAIADNDWVSLNYGEAAVDPNNKASWRYYLNICGEYHTTDEVIRITSLDTLEVIDFTKANLAIHTATARAYRYGSRYYRELLLSYPNSERLILGVLHPATMSKALSAESGTVLSYPGYLIESNESSLIRNIEQWVKKWRVRWYNVQFSNNHSLYNAAVQGVMYQQLIMEIINLRLRACKTDEVHTFHIREYLASHGNLDRYLEFMTRKQALFFYRNIAYIERNNGKQNIFDWLKDNVLTDRSIPIAEYSMQHKLTNLTATNYAEPRFKKTALNDVYTADESLDDTLDLDQLFVKEQRLAPNNLYYASQNRMRISNLLVDSRADTVKTKVLESSILDYTDFAPYTLQNIALSNWAYLSHEGIYNTFIRVRNPKDGSEIVVSSKDAYVYYMYLFASAVGNEFQMLPELGAIRAPQLPTPAADALMVIADPKYVDPADVQFVINGKPVIPVMNSVDAFAAKVKQLYDCSQNEWKLIGSKEHEYRRGTLENIVNATYFDVKLNYGAPTPMATWLQQKNLPNDFTDEQKITLYLELFEAATGVPVNTTASMGALQRAMVGIMQQVSSYSIQFITEINSTAIRPLNWAMIRTGDDKTVEKSFIPVHDTDINAIYDETKVFDKTEVEIGPVLATPVTTVTSSIEEIEIPVKVGPADGYIATVGIINFGTSTFTANPAQEYAATGPIRHLLSYQPYYDLTEVQQATIKSIYTYMPVVKDNTHIDIQDVLTRDTLVSFKYLSFTEPTTVSYKYQYLPSSIPNGVKPVVRAEIGTLDYTGGSFRSSGFVYLGSDDRLDTFQYIGKDMNVDGFSHFPGDVELPINTLHSEWGLGDSIGKIEYVGEQAQTPFANTFHYTNVTVRRIADKTSVGAIENITDHQNLLMTNNHGEHFANATSGPFFSDPDSMNGPHYTLGKFVIGEDNKTEFE